MGCRCSFELISEGNHWLSSHLISRSGTIQKVMEQTVLEREVLIRVCFGWKFVRLDLFFFELRKGSILCGNADTQENGCVEKGAQCCCVVSTEDQRKQRKFQSNCRVVWVRDPAIKSPCNGLFSWNHNDSSVPISPQAE